MKPCDAICGPITGLLIALGFVTSGWTATSSLAAEAELANTVLVVDGKVPGGVPVALDLARLKSLPAVTITTATPWSEGENTFVGVRLRDLLESLGAAGTSVVASAIDEYQIAIPEEDIHGYDVIIAYAMNGKPLPLDDKGPLWIVYPFSAHFSLQKDVYYSRSVWQLNRLTLQ